MGCCFDIMAFPWMGSDVSAGVFLERLKKESSDDVHGMTLRIGGEPQEFRGRGCRKRLL